MLHRKSEIRKISLTEVRWEVYIYIMASNKKTADYNGNINKSFSVAIIAVFLLGTFLTVVYIGQRTQWFNQAAGPSTLPNRAMINLNSTTDTLDSINPDGTMGPLTSYGNWSNSLPSYLKGKLVFAVTDPAPENKPSNPGSKDKKPNESISAQPTTAPLPSSSQTTPTNQILPQQAKSNGPQSVTALNISVRKVEVHLTFQGKVEEGPDGTPDVSEEPSLSPIPGKNVDHWETLSITSPFTVDLVALAKNGDFSELGLTNLAEGRYTEIRLYVDSATATLTNGTVVDLRIPGKNNIVRVVRPFVVSAGQATKITMDFDAQHSVIRTGNNYILKPVIARLLKDKKSK